MRMRMPRPHPFVVGLAVVSLWTVTETAAPQPPAAHQPATPAADIDEKAVLRGDSMVFIVSLSCSDPAASIAYRLASEKKYSGPWQGYTGPFEAPANRRFIEVQTHSVGHLPTITGALLGRE
jgi:hypothetical protein